MKYHAGRRALATAAPAYAFNPVARAPSTKFPPVAAAKKLSVSQSGQGVQLATVEDPQSPIASVALVLQAGPRFQSGIAELGAAQWLKSLGFKSTNNRSAIRITSEAEITGSALSAALTRESLVLNIDCIRDDVGDAVALLGDVVDGIVRRDMEPAGIYTREYVRKSKQWYDAVDQVTRDTMLAHSTDPSTLVLDQLHFVAFRHGLGNPLYPNVGSLDVEAAVNYAVKCAQPSRMSLFGFGVAHADITAAFEQQWSSVKFPSSAGSSLAQPSKYFGGEVMDNAACRDVHYALAFNGASLTSTDFATQTVLQHLLGGSQDPTLKYSPTTGSLLHAVTGGAVVKPLSLSYSDAGLFGVYVQGSSGEQVTQAAKQSVEILRSVANGQGAQSVGRAIAQAKLALATTYETSSRLDKVSAYGTQLASARKLVSVGQLLTGLDAVTPAAVASFAGKLLKSKPSVASVGDVFAVPHADELGL